MLTQLQRARQLLLSCYLGIGNRSLQKESGMERLVVVAGSRHITTAWVACPSHIRVLEALNTDLSFQRFERTWHNPPSFGGFYDVLCTPHLFSTSWDLCHLLLGAHGLQIQHPREAREPTSNLAINNARKLPAMWNWSPHSAL